MGLTRREVLMVGGAKCGTCRCPLFAGGAGAQDETAEFVEQLTGRTTESDRLHLIMPAVFPTGYTVPMDVTIDSPMTEADHVRRVRVFAPENPLIEVASFHFVPQRSEPRVSTRIRLAEPQDVAGGRGDERRRVLMTKAWVEVATNGCI